MKGKFSKYVEGGIILLDASASGIDAGSALLFEEGTDDGSMALSGVTRLENLEMASQIGWITFWIHPNHSLGNQYDFLVDGRTTGVLPRKGQRACRRSWNAISIWYWSNVWSNILYLSYDKIRN